MPINFNEPVTTTNYSVLVSGLLDGKVAQARLLDPATAGTLTGTPTGAFRINGSASNAYFEKFNGTSWAVQAMNYPTLTGVGASGTWGIAISGNAATATLAASASAVDWSGISNAPAITGLTAATSTTVSTVARRDSTGRLFAESFVQPSSNSENPTVSQIVVTNGIDSQFRKASLSHVGNSITVPWANISGKPTTLSSFSNDVGFITSVAWTSVSGRPTAVSAFTNDSAYVASPTATQAFDATLRGSTTAGSCVYTTQVGQWREVGDRTYFNLQIQTSSITGTAGTIQIVLTGLPVSAEEGEVAFSVLAENLNSAAPPIFASLAVGSRTLNICAYQVGSTRVNIGVANLAQTFKITINGHYKS